MKNLIMADLKVLGHRIWAVPLVILMFTILFNFVIPGHNNHQSLKYFHVPLTAGILGYFLMEIWSHNRLHLEMNSLPCSKYSIVFQKYLMIFLFVAIGILSLSLFLEIMSLTTDYTFNATDFYNAVNYPMPILTKLSVFVIPLFFKFKNQKTALFGTIFWFLCLIPFISLSIYSVSKQNTQQDLFLYIFLLIISVIVITIFYIKENKSPKIKQLIFIPVVTVFTVALGRMISILADFLFNLSLSKFKPDIFKRFNGYYETFNMDAGTYKSIMELYYELLKTNGTALLVSTVLMLYVWKKGNIRNIMATTFQFITLPVIFITLEFFLLFAVFGADLIISSNSTFFNTDTHFFIADYMIFVLMLIASFYYSKKFLTEGGK